MSRSAVLAALLCALVACGRDDTSSDGFSFDEPLDNGGDQRVDAGPGDGGGDGDVGRDDLGRGDPGPDVGTPPEPIDAWCAGVTAEAGFPELGRWASDIRMLILTMATFRARRGEGEVIADDRVAWTLTGSPPGSGSTLEPTKDGSPSLILDRGGEYTLEAIVSREDGLSCAPKTVRITAGGAENVAIQLRWTPDPTTGVGDPDSSDLDVLYLNTQGTWADAEWVIGGDRLTANWGYRSVMDDPLLDLNVRDGAQPENLAHDWPESKKDYGVGVRHTAGDRTAFATLAVYLDGQLIYERADVALEPGQFWDAARVNWDERRVEPVDVISESFPPQP